MQPKTIRNWLMLQLTLAVLGMSACGPLITQNPNEGWRPVNVKSVTGADRLLLDGYEVVGMMVNNQARQGDPNIRSPYKGVAAP